MSAKRRRTALLYWYSLGHRRCRYCNCQLVYNPGQKNTATVEHLVPQSVGGTDALVNLIIVCTTCNHKRGNARLTQWAKGRPLEDWIIKKYADALRFYVKTNRSINVSKTERKILLAA